MCETGTGGGGGRCWGKGKLGSGVNPPSSLKYFHSRASPPRVQGHGFLSAGRVPGLQKSRRVAGFCLYSGEELGVLQVLESPKDTRTAATAGMGRRGRDGRRCLLRAAAPWALTETARVLASGPRTPPRLYCSTPSEWRWCSLGPGLGAGETPRDVHSGDTASHSSL